MPGRSDGVLPAACCLLPAVVYGSTSLTSFAPKPFQESPCGLGSKRGSVASMHKKKRSRVARRSGAR